MPVTAVPTPITCCHSTSPTSKTRKIGVLIADDHGVILRGLRTLLDSSRTCEVVAVARTGKEAINQACETQPDVAVLDLGMPLLNGLEATAQIRIVSPATQVLILTGHESEQIADATLHAGAHGYLIKSEAASDLIPAVESVAKGRPFLSTALAQKVLQGYLQAHPDPGVLGLTTRERQTIQLLAEGYSNKEIASQQGIAVKTAEKHHANILKKLKLRSISDIVHFAVRNRIIFA